MKLLAAPNSNSISSGLHAPVLDYEVAELTWKNGQLAMHGPKPPAAVTKYAWDKPRAAETLETIVNQATFQPNCKPDNDPYAVPWLDHHSSAFAPGSVSASAMDALVPTSGTQPQALLSGTNGGRTACSMRVGSDRSGFGDHMVAHGGVAAAVAREENSCRGESGSETFGSRQLTVETRNCVKGFTSTSMGSPEDSVSGKRSTKSTSPDEHADSVCHSRPQIQPEEKKKGKLKSSIATKRSRAAAIHNQSERRRRDKINQKMKTLQKLVPNANKTDKASMLDEVIEYLKQLQAQIKTMSKMSMSPMMMPLAMQMQQQQLLQMNMMNPMGLMGMGMGMGVIDLNANSIMNGSGSRPGLMPPVFNPTTFMHPMMASWDHMHAAATGDRIPNHNADPMPAFLASQAHLPMTMMKDYSRMAAMFQQMQNQL